MLSWLQNLPNESPLQHLAADTFSETSRLTRDFVMSLNDKVTSSRKNLPVRKMISRQTEEEFRQRILFKWGWKLRDSFDGCDLCAGRHQISGDLNLVNDACELTEAINEFRDASIAYRFHAKSDQRFDAKPRQVHASFSFVWCKHWRIYPTPI